MLLKKLSSTLIKADNDGREDALFAEAVDHAVEITNTPVDTPVDPVVQQAVNNLNIEKDTTDEIKKDYVTSEINKSLYPEAPECPDCKDDCGPCAKMNADDYQKINLAIDRYAETKSPEDKKIIMKMVLGINNVLPKMCDTKPVDARIQSTVNHAYQTLNEKFPMAESTIDKATLKRMLTELAAKL